jgi:hypothetical protein
MRTRSPSFDGDAGSTPSRGTNGVALATSLLVDVEVDGAGARVAHTNAYTPPPAQTTAAARTAAR